MKTVVITGATGSIGRSLINICIEEGYEVLAIVHRSSPRAAELERIKNCHVLFLDLSEYGCAVDEIKRQNIQLEGYDLFFHLAWRAAFGSGRDDLELQLENVNCSLSAVRLAKELGCNTFIGAGSQAEYGRVEGAMSDDTPAFPETGYGIAKLCAGQMTRLECKKQGLNHIWTRILSVYGPYDADYTLISTAVRCMLNNQETEFTKCEQMWDYIYSDDAARAILLAGQKGEDGRIYVIGSGNVKPLSEYIKIIATITGYKKQIGFGKRLYNDQQVMYLKADMTPLEEIGFSISTSFAEGIQRICEAYAPGRSRK